MAQAEHWRRETLPGLDDETAISVTVALVHAFSSARFRWAARMLLPGLHRRRLPWDRVDVALLFALAARVKGGTAMLDALKVATSAARCLAPADAATLAPEIGRALTWVESEEGRAGDRARLRTKLRALLPAAEERASRVDTQLIREGDGWSQLAIERLAAVDEHADRVTQLVDHVAGATAGPRPTKAWERRARELTAGVPGIEALVRELLEACGDVRAGAHARFTARGCGCGSIPTTPSWCAGCSGWPVCSMTTGSSRSSPRSRLPAAWSATTRWSTRRSRRWAGPGGRMGSPLSSSSSGPRATAAWLKQIARALDEAAAAAGLTRSELLERAVPDGGLDPDGVRRADVGDAVAIVSLEPGGQVSLEWERDGQRTSRLPGQVADDHRSRVAAIKRDVAELRRLVAAERDRLEDLLVEDRDWPFEQWRTTYLGHPVTRALAGRLIWRIDDGDVAYQPCRSNRRPSRGRTAPGSSPERARASGRGIRARADPAQVRAWRAFLVEHEIVQPFKQAFREVYLLTPAEEETRVYSNRFGAHVLRYQQTYALMKQRRWATNYLGPWDGGFHGEAKRDFDGARLQAVFFHEAVDADGNDVAYCTTDQVRFVARRRPVARARPARRGAAVGLLRGDARRRPVRRGDVHRRRPDLGGPGRGPPFRSTGSASPSAS